MRLRRGRHQARRPVLVHVILALLALALVLAYVAGREPTVELGPLMR